MLIQIDLNDKLSSVNAETLVNQEAYIDPTHPNYAATNAAAQRWFQAHYTKPDAVIHPAPPIVINT